MYLVTKFILLRLIIKHFDKITYLTNTHSFLEDNVGWYS